MPTVKEESIQEEEELLRLQALSQVGSIRFEESVFVPLTPEGKDEIQRMIGQNFDQVRGSKLIKQSKTGTYFLQISFGQFLLVFGMNNSRKELISGGEVYLSYPM